MYIRDKEIRKFKDLEGNIYKIMKKANNHNYLVVYCQGERAGKIIEGSRNELLKYLGELYKSTKFVDIC